MDTFQIALVIIIPVALAWIFFRYIIRLVKANEAMADSMDDIAQSLKNINDILNAKEEKDNNQEQ